MSAVIALDVDVQDQLQLAALASHPPSAASPAGGGERTTSVLDGKLPRMRRGGSCSKPYFALPYLTRWSAENLVASACRSDRRITLILEHSERHHRRQRHDLERS